MIFWFDGAGGGGHCGLECAAYGSLTNDDDPQSVVGEVVEVVLLDNGQ